jgi:hypothetical protein
VNCSPVLNLIFRAESKKPVQHCRWACPPHRTLSTCLLQCTLHRFFITCDSAQQYHHVCELFPVLNIIIRAESKKPVQHCRWACPPHRTLSTCLLQCTIHRSVLTCDSAQQHHHVCELFPGAESHISSRIEETSAALQVGMSPTQNIEHMSLTMHSTQVCYNL